MLASLLRPASSYDLAMMLLPRSVARAALRHGRANAKLAPASTKISLPAYYHSYSLPRTSPSPPSSDDIAETSSSSSTSPSEALPRVHETRPPAMPAQRDQARTPHEHQKQQRAEQKPPGPPVAEAAAPATASPPPAAKTKAARPRSKLRPRKAAMTLTPSAVEQLRSLLDQPEPKLIKVGVRNRGCSGLAYHLEYVEKPGAFDEAVEQDGVKVLIDSKALFSIIGSEMDWAEDKLNQRFVFRNPNIKEECGCGESFMV